MDQYNQNTNQPGWKMVVYTAAGLSLLFSGWQIKKLLANYSTQSRPKTKITEEDGLTIRYYPPAIMATVLSKGSFKRVQNKGMKQLLNYISGDNDVEQKIEMTKPVVTSYDEDTHLGAVSFVVPKAYSLDKVPRPYSDEIRLHISEGGYKAGLSFGGFAGHEEFLTKKGELIENLEAEGLEFMDNFEYLIYNDPWQLFGRKNEIVVSIQNFDL